MTGRPRHGLHLVTDGTAPDPTPVTPVSKAPGSGTGGSVHLHLSSVALAVGGRLDAHTAGRLRILLSVFTAGGGPRELVLDLSDVVAVDDEGMAPIVEAEDLLVLRGASLRLTSVSMAVARFLDDPRCDRTLLADRPPVTVGSREIRRPDDDPGRG